MERWRARSVPVQEHFESLEPVLALRSVTQLFTSGVFIRGGCWMHDARVRGRRFGPRWAGASFGLAGCSGFYFAIVALSFDKRRIQEYGWSPVLPRRGCRGGADPLNRRVSATEPL